MTEVTAILFLVNFAAVISLALSAARALSVVGEFGQYP